METTVKPKLRPHLTIAHDEENPNSILVWDRLGICERAQRFTKAEFRLFQLFNGERSLQAIQNEAGSVNGDGPVTLSTLEALTARLERASLLDGPRFRQRVDSPIREPSCIGCYEGNPVLLRKQLHQLFTGPRGAGLPRNAEPHRNLRAALIPHIDYLRGGHTYTWAFKEVVEQTDASLFVIIGTSHYSMHRFTLTRKHFKTPLGVVPTDQEYIDRLVRHFGDGLFDDEWMAHLPEHSIELEVVFLQYLYQNKKPIRIVPLVVGSFWDSIQQRRPPTTCEDIARMIGALQKAEEELTEPVCYLISGDLAHLGPKFGDRRRVLGPLLDHSREMDYALIRGAEAADTGAMFELVAGEGDARRICGFPPGYLTLEVARPSRGKLLHYDRYVHPRGFESVSFASMAFYQ